MNKEHLTEPNNQDQRRPATPQDLEVIIKDTLLNRYNAKEQSDIAEKNVNDLLKTIAADWSRQFYRIQSLEAEIKELKDQLDKSQHKLEKKAA